MPAVFRGGVPITWHEVGPTGGRPVLVIHGFGSNSKQNWLDTGWEAPLADAGIRAVLMDLRGHGDSGRPVGPQHYALRTLVGDLVAVLDASDLDSVGVLGYSFGSRLGWELALAHPERVDRLVLGGFSRSDPLESFDRAAAHAHLEDGTEIDDTRTAALMGIAELVPGNDVPRLLDLVTALQSARPADGPGHPPDVPICFVTGERDELGDGVPELAVEIGAEFVPIKARTHVNAVSARGFKRAAVARLGQCASRIVDSRTVPGWPANTRLGAEPPSNPRVTCCTPCPTAIAEDDV
ncbi:alpha/beta hydrolase [Georgenia halophila]|uniref:Alpha/beta hydrolase n=1 Tax=Georgenia halophila TaxID=620889 RepID=A0ABP8LMV8_9MICO